MTDEYAAARTFVTEHVGRTDIGDDEDLFATGLASSLFAVQLVMWVERTFHTPVSASDLEIANFSSISRVVGFIRRQGGGGARSEAHRDAGVAAT